MWVYYSGDLESPRISYVAVLAGGALYAAVLYERGYDVGRAYRTGKGVHNS